MEAKVVRTCYGTCVHLTYGAQFLKPGREEQEEKPDKDFAAKSLQRATKVLKEAGETVDAGTSLWSKVQPIINRLSPWLGVAASFFA